MSHTYFRSYSTIAILSLGAVAQALAYPNRVPAGNAGVPGESSPPCSSCHTVSLNPSGGNVSLTFAGGTSYQPGVGQLVTVRISDPDTSRTYGFQATARIVSGNAQAGAFTAGTATTVTSQGALAYINQTNSASSYSFTWTPPAAASGTIRFYAAGMAARSTRDSKVYTATADLTPASSAVPKLRSSNAVVNAAGFQAKIAPGAWISIFGENLAGLSRIWTASEIVDGRLPRSLEGLSVTVNGRDASVYFVSPTQVNVQSPDDMSTGTVEVKVTTPAGSATTTATLDRISPALFTLSPESGRYAAAVHADGTLAGKAELYGGNPATRVAKPGDVLLLYGTGFGATSPAVPAGTVVASPAALADTSTLRIRIGGVEAKLLYAGVVSAGLYQFNIEVPAVGVGDQTLTAEVASQASQSGLYLTIGQ